MTTGPIDFARKFHRDRRGQIMPLVFFLGIAFFTGVILVVNTGRTVTGRIQAQNGVDAAVVSGTAALARGMNYISSNNISMAKILATVVILRAFPGAIDNSRTTLTVWEIAANLMDAAGKALAAVPFCQAAGVALQAAATVIKLKVKQERKTLDFVEKAYNIAKKWDNDGNGPAWIILKILAKLGDLISYTSPLIAQWTAYTVFQQNLAPGEKGAGWMLPLYPKMPSCKGKFADFVDKVSFYAERFSKPITIAGWILLTLSLFPVWYMEHLKAEIKKLFTGEETEVSTEGKDPDQEKIKELQKEIKKHQDKIDLELNPHLVKVNQQIASVNNHDDPTVHPELGTNLTTLQQDKINTQAQINAERDAIDDLNEQITEITNRRGQKGSGQPDDFSNGVGTPVAKGSVKDNKDVYPYMLDGKEWPKSFTYFCLGYRSIPAPTTETVFKKPMSTGYVYASARLVNSVGADLWTPAWHARLVRATASVLPTNPVGSLPAACGEEGESGGMEVGAMGEDAPPDADEENGILQKLMGMLSKH